MHGIALKRLFIVLTLFSFVFLIGCAGMEFAPKKAIWYYPKELVEADRAVADAEKAGKAKTCPVEFKEAKAVKDKAYEIYWACHTKEAIEMAKKATKMVKALCPAKPKKEVRVIDKMTIMVNFDFDKADIRDEDKPELKKALDFVKKYPGAKIKVEGHTDHTGTDVYNMGLSERRALSVKNYLVKDGKIDTKKITIKGYGKTKPVATNATKEGRAKNRRVEILILGD
jgi:outer membrane protein OmpA-like peptidoglycan-associated protein